MWQRSSIENLLLQSCVWILCSMQGFFITLRPDFQDPRLRRRSPLPSPGPAFWTPFVRARWRKYYLLPKMKTRQDKMKTTRKKSYLFTSPPTLPPSSFSQAGWLSVDPDQHCLFCIPKHPKHHRLLHQHGLKYFVVMLMQLEMFLGPPSTLSATHSFSAVSSTQAW